MGEGLLDVVARSYLYVPGVSAEKLASAPDRGADALILDLEDSVAVAEKSAARAGVVKWFESAAAERTEAWVRVNSGAEGEEDLRAVACCPGLAGIVLAKVDGESVVRRRADLLLELGYVDVPLMPLIETAAGVLAAPAVAACASVSQLQLGEVDLAGELRLAPGPDELELVGPRTQIVLASVAAGIRPPVGAVFTAIRDLAGLETSTQRLRRLGFFGRACIHPDQIPVIHRTFAPPPDEVDHAREVLRLLTEAERRGDAVVVDCAGTMIDPAHLRAARWTVSLADRPDRLGSS